MTTNTNTNTNNTSTIDPAVDLTDPTSVVDAWLVGYAESDVTRLQALIAQAWAADGRLVDPPFEGTGHDELSGLVDIVLTHYAGHTFRRTSKVDEHHGFARYNWQLVGPDGTVAVAGTDIARFADDGKLAGVVGFFGALEDDVA
jgi:hypothetical protein